MPRALPGLDSGPMNRTLAVITAVISLLVVAAPAGAAEQPKVEKAYFSVTCLTHFAAVRLNRAPSRKATSSHLTRCRFGAGWMESLMDGTVHVVSPSDTNVPDL